MPNDFLKVDGLHFSLGGRYITLRGFSLGSWLLSEHFMLGLPGTESQLHAALVTAYGREKAEAFWNRFRDRFITEADFEFLKSLGINVVRIPFNYRLLEDDQRPYEYNEAGFSHLDRVLALCEKYRIFAIPDLHSAPGGQNPDWHADNEVGEALFWKYADFRKRIISLWQHIAHRYHNNPWIAGYDLLNEPCADPGQEKLFVDFFDELISAVRRVDAKHIVFLQGNFYGRNMNIFSPSMDPQVAYSFHYYPHFFLRRLKGRNRPRLLERDFLENMTIPQFRERLARPLWCGETGVAAGMVRPKERLLLYNELLDVLEKNRISWTLWTYKDIGRMGLVSPGVDTAWMAFSRKALGGWSLNHEFGVGPKVAKKRLGRYYRGAADGVKRKITYRYYAEHQYVMSQIYWKLFSHTPFDTLLSFLESFLFSRCAVWNDGADAVKKHIPPDLNDGGTSEADRRNRG